MTIHWTERPDSRSLDDNPGSLEAKYDLYGTSDEVVAYSLARDFAPSAWYAAGQVLYRSNIALDFRGHDKWIATVSYSPENRQVNNWDFEFDTSGGTVHITQSKETLGAYPVPTPPLAGPPEYKGAIDVDGDSVKGTEIVIPALRMTYSFRWPAGAVNEAFARAIARATGKTNSATWHGFAAGELLFLGCTGKSGSSCETTLTYHMAASENASGLTIGDVAGVAKRGWDLVWIKYMPEISNDRPVRQPEFVYVERVYDEINFGSALGF